MGSPSWVGCKENPTCWNTLPETKSKSTRKVHDWKTILSFKKAIWTYFQVLLLLVSGRVSCFLNGGIWVMDLILCRSWREKMWRTGGTHTPMWYFPIGKWWIFSIISSTYMCVPQGYSCLVMTCLVSNRLKVGVDLPKDPLRNVGTWNIHSMSILHPMFFSWPWRSHQWEAGRCFSQRTVVVWRKEDQPPCDLQRKKHLS